MEVGDLVTEKIMRIQISCISEESLGKFWICISHGVELRSCSQLIELKGAECFSADAVGCRLSWIIRKPCFRDPSLQVRTFEFIYWCETFIDNQLLTQLNYESVYFSYLVVVVQPIKYPDKLQVSCEPMLCFWKLSILSLSWYIRV